MTDVFCRIEGHVGRITLTRPDALNALTHEMCLTMEAALDAWQQVVELVIIDAEGDKAFCAGGDISKLYESAQRNDVAYGRKFWQDEYRFNAKLKEYPVPIVSFLQGFVLGGGVGLGCHVSYRIVCENTKVAMPECGIGLLPDVGGSLLMANAPGYSGRYLGLSGARMGPGDAIFTGFADSFVPYDQWNTLKSYLIEIGDISGISEFACTAPNSVISENMTSIDACFSADSVGEIIENLKASDSAIATQALKAVQRGGPLALMCCFEVWNRLQDTKNLRDALALEFRFTARAVEQGDFPEGVRAAIIDKDHSPVWTHASVADVKPSDVEAMLSDLGTDALNLETAK